MEHTPDKKAPILVVDDDVGFLLSVKATLVSAGLPEPALVSDSRWVIELVRTHHFQLVLLDLIMPSISGMDVLRQLKEEFPLIECIVITAVDDVPSAIQAMKSGAYDYLVKPIEKDRLLIAINRALERYTLRRSLSIYETSPSFSELRNPSAFKAMVASDKIMARIFHQAEAAAPTNYNMVITGETGTGKEMLARTIHALSHYSGGPFVAVNMASFSKQLFEDEFFGHLKGAFTGSQGDRNGFFEAAQGGTLCLDEIAELELELQGKLLRVIETKELYRVGSTKIRTFDARLIASSNRDIYEEVKNKRFRNDLFQRLNVFHIHLPPLRERKEDILPLARYFLKKYAEKNQKEIDSLSPELADRLLEYPFPGNVRELENIMATAVVMEKGKVLTLKAARKLTSSSELGQGRSDPLLTLAELERRHVQKVLQATGGNRTRAAKILGIGLRTLRRKLN